MNLVTVKRKTKSDLQFEKRGLFSDKYDYETFDFALCAVCAYFSFHNSKDNVEWAGKNGCGSCRLMRSQGIYNGVMTTAVCNKFLSWQGKDINQKQVNKKRLPNFVKLVQNEKGKTFVSIQSNG